MLGGGGGGRAGAGAGAGRAGARVVATVVRGAAIRLPVLRGLGTTTTMSAKRRSGGGGVSVSMGAIRTPTMGGSAKKAAESGCDTEGKKFRSIQQLWREELMEEATEASSASAAATTASPETPADAAAAAVAAASPATSASTATAGTKRKLDPSSSSSSSSSSTHVVSDTKRQQWYQRGAEYWETQDATTNGVLGGFGHLSPIDGRDSTVFLKTLPGVRFGTAIDCGAGIGRVAKDVLCPLFQEVDLVEQCAKYVQTARETITKPQMKGFFVSGLQDFTFEAGRYDVIWIQWVVSHLTDDDLIAFLDRCHKGIAPGGYICLKENTAKDGFVMDRADYSVTRPDALFRSIFARAGFHIVRHAVQTNFPKELFSVHMYALQKVVSPSPASASSSSTSSMSSSASSTSSA